MLFHIEHHIYAADPFYNLHKLHDAISYNTPEPVRGYFRGVKRNNGFNEKAEAEQNLGFLPVLPPTAAPAKMS